MEKSRDDSFSDSTAGTIFGRRQWAKDQFAKQAKEAGLVISSCGLLHRDLKSLQRVEWDSVILDEAQNVKNPGTKQSQAARSLSIVP